jgi:hypothetical protein
MVLLPGCECCPPPCPRPCPSIRYVAIRFQVAAASGNPIYSSLPLTVESDYTAEPTYSWTPPGILSTASSPAVDETLVVDLFREPGFSVVGTYGTITVNAQCVVSYQFSHKITLGDWPIFTYDSATNNFRFPRTLSETVSVRSSKFPLGVWDNAQFEWKDEYRWTSGGTIDPEKIRAIARQPATFRECSSPDSWSTMSDVTTGTYPSVGGSYFRPEPSTGQTNIVPYYDPGSPGFPNAGKPEYLAGESFASPLLWRRLLPDPVVTITVS